MANSKELPFTTHGAYRTIVRMQLPNQHNHWTWGMSLALYSKPYRETNGEQVNTTQGDMINRFKYHEELSDVERKEISQNFANQVFKLITNELRQKFPNPKNPPFDVCLGLPENRNTGRSLPRDLCRILSEEHFWLRDGFASVTKTRTGVVMKAIPHDERPEKVKGLYKIDHQFLPEPLRGFLIIDDVFETGSTVGGLCDTLEHDFPKLPRYIIALTHLHATERMLK